MNKWREWVNRNAAVTTVGAVVVTLLALAVTVLSLAGSGGRAPATQSYFYDMTTKTLFAAPLDAVPPIAAPSGPYKGGDGGVKAYVYACGECKADTLRIAYLEVLSPKAKEARVKQLQEDEQAAPIRDGLLQKTVDGEWTPITDPKISRVRESASAIRKDCQAKKLQMISCWPD